MRKRFVLILFCALCASSAVAITLNSVHAKFLIIGNGAAPPIDHGADIGGFGGETIGGFGGENIGGLP